MPLVSQHQLAKHCCKGAPGTGRNTTVSIHRADECICLSYFRKVNIRESALQETPDAGAVGVLPHCIPAASVMEAPVEKIPECALRLFGICGNVHGTEGQYR